MNNKYQVSIDEDGKVGFSCDSVQDAVELMRVLRRDKTAPEVNKTTAIKSDPQVVSKKATPRSQTQTNQPSTRRRKSFAKMTAKEAGITSGGRWEDDEIKRVYDLYTNGSGCTLMCSDPVLTRRHSPGSISAVYYGIRNERYLKVGYESAFYRKYDAYRRLMKGENLQKKQDAHEAGVAATTASVPTFGWSRN
jgi:hypothetical protein